MYEQGLAVDLLRYLSLCLAGLPPTTACPSGPQYFTRQSSDIFFMLQGTASWWRTKRSSAVVRQNKRALSMSLAGGLDSRPAMLPRLRGSIDCGS
jgi:hypothetical protein